MDHNFISEEEFLKIDSACSKAASAYADHVHALKIFEALSKDMLASIKMKLRSETLDKMSEAELETRARASEEWIEFRNQQIEELKEAGRLEISYESVKRKWETMRSIISLKKREIERMPS